MSVVSTGAIRAAAVGAITALVVASGAPAYADGHVTVTPDGASAAGVTGTSGTSQATPGHTGSPGTGYTGTGSSSSGGSRHLDLRRRDHGAAHVRLLPGLHVRSSTSVPRSPRAEQEPGRPAARPQVTTEMVVEAARVTAPANPPHVEPGTVSYVNIPNNYWTESPTVNDSVTVVGPDDPARVDSDRHDLELR